MKSEQLNDFKMTEWQLFHIAHALTRAKRLEKRRHAFYQELYENIPVPTVHLDKEFTSDTGSPSVETQAFRLMEAKERYDRKIKGEYKRYVRWKDLLKWASDTDRILLFQYFEKKKSVRPEIIERLLSRISERVEEDEKRIEWERQKQSIEAYLDYQAKSNAFNVETIEPIESKPVVKQYLIRGRFEYMASEEYAAYIQQLNEAENRRDYIVN